MTATYTNSPGTDSIDAIRLLIGDTDVASAALTDEELQYYLDTAGNLYLAAAYAVEAIMSAQGGGITSKQVGDLKVTYGGAGGASGLAALAKTLRMRAARTSGTPYAGGISVADREALDADTDRTASAFVVGQDDNPSVDTTETGVVSW